MVTGGMVLELFQMNRKTADQGTDNREDVRKCKRKL